MPSPSATPSPSASVPCYDGDCDSDSGSMSDGSDHSDGWWSFTEWRRCTPNSGSDCGAGVQFRDAYCLSPGGRPLADQECVDSDSDPIVQRACFTYTCNQPYRIDFGRWGHCSAQCGGGTAQRSIACIDTRTEQQVAMSACAAISVGIDMSDTRPCHTHPCRTVVSWDTTDWVTVQRASDVMIVDDPSHVGRGNSSSSSGDDHTTSSPPFTISDNGTVSMTSTQLETYADSVLCGGLRFRVVTCVDDTGSPTDDAECVAAGLPKPSAVEPVGTCDVCTQQSWSGTTTDTSVECSGHGHCSGATSCTCVGGWGDAVCRTPPHCASRGGIVDNRGQCCLNALDADGGCCQSEHALLDGAGQCCESGVVDACGVCDGAGVVVDVQGRCCDGKLDAGGLCCPAGNTVDRCGVCAGLSECLVEFAWEVALPVSRLQEVQPGGLTAAEQFVVDVLEVDAELVTVEIRTQSTATAPPSSAPPSSASSASSSVVVVTLRDSEVVEERSLDALLRDTTTDSELGTAFGSVELLPARGTCGNGMCEVGERCAGDNAESCCASDCPAAVLDGCPVSGGRLCGGHGVCVSGGPDGAGVCECFADAGYTGEGCGECVPGFAQRSDGGCYPAFSANFVPSDAAGSQTGTQVQAAASSGASSLVFMVGIGIVVVGAVVAVAVLLAKVRRQRNAAASVLPAGDDEEASGIASERSAGPQSAAVLVSPSWHQRHSHNKGYPAAGVQSQRDVSDGPHGSLHHAAGTDVQALFTVAGARPVPSGSPQAAAEPGRAHDLSDVAETVSVQAQRVPIASSESSGGGMAAAAASLPLPQAGPLPPLVGRALGAHSARPVADGDGIDVLQATVPEHRPSPRVATQPAPPEPHPPSTPLRHKTSALSVERDVLGHVAIRELASSQPLFASLPMLPGVAEDAAVEHSGGMAASLTRRTFADVLAEEAAEAAAAASPQAAPHDVHNDDEEEEGQVPRPKAMTWTELPPIRSSRRPGENGAEEVDAVADLFGTFDELADDEGGH